MIMSGTLNRSNSRWLLAGALLCAVFSLPVGVANAQDCDAVERRLGAAVSDGELSLEQAVVMMKALRSVAKGGDRGVEERLKAVGERIKAAVKAGGMTEKEGWAKWHEVRERLIKGAVEAGKMSREDAGVLWRGIEKAEIGGRLKAAVAKGEITTKEALAKWAAINKEGNPKRGDNPKHITPEDLERAGIEIRKAVAAGKITPEQARAKMEAMRGMMDGHGERSEKPGQAKHDAPDWDAIKHRIEGAVKAAKLTREEANKHYEGIKKRMPPKHQANADLEAAWKKLQAMVKAGKLTEKQAHAKMAAIKKQAAAKAKGR